MDRLRDTKRSRPFWRLTLPQAVDHEFRGQLGHPSSYAYVQFECAPADDLSFESKAIWPFSVSKEEQTKLEIAVAEAVADTLLEGICQHSGCRVVLLEVRYDDIGSSQGAFMNAAKAAMHRLLETKWTITPRQ